MIVHHCDICGKKLQNKSVMMETDPMDYRYGELDIEFSIGLQGYYEAEFEDVCHECARKIQNIDMDDFKEFFVEKFMRQDYN